MFIIDFYKGFEGYPEVKIICKKPDKVEPILEMTLWDGYFKEIIELVEPNEQGEWEGFLLTYNPCLDWDINHPWICDDLPLLHRQLTHIDTNKLEITHDLIYKTLINTVEFCMQKKYVLQIYED